MKPALIKPLNDDQKACVECLEDALGEARDGKIRALALVAVMDKGYATVLGGNALGDLNLGLDDLKRKVLDAVVVPKKSVLQLS